MPKKLNIKITNLLNLTLRSQEEQGKWYYKETDQKKIQKKNPLTLYTFSANKTHIICLSGPDLIHLAQ